MEKSGVIVLDFETTGLSPDQGDRAIEIGAVHICDNEIVGQFNSLMNPGRRISGFIENYTGITNAMLAEAPSVEEVMSAFATFMGPHPLVAHNASFDQRFLDAELRRIKSRRRQAFACSMLISRRLYSDAPNHRLETLVRYKNLPTDGVYHRALADAAMTARLWMRMTDDMRESFKVRHTPFELMRRLSKVKKSMVPTFLAGVADEQNREGERP